MRPRCPRGRGRTCLARGSSSSASVRVSQGPGTHLVERGDPLDDLVDPRLAQGHETIRDRALLDLVLVRAIQNQSADVTVQLQHLEQRDAARIARSEEHTSELQSPYV